MIYINKQQPISQNGRQYIQDWLGTKKDEDTDGNERTFKQYLATVLDDDSKTGNTIWDIMTDKKALKRSLLCEQGFVCCYCGRRLFADFNTHLEHLKAKGKKEEGKYINKQYIFDYDNLMACCFGSSKDIIHIVENSAETIESIAAKYAVSKDKIEELYIDDTNYESVKKKYDIENLKIGDKVLIIEKCEKEHQHCGPKKEDGDISIHPLHINCQELFRYKRQDEEVKIEHFTEGDTHATIQTLGLNDNQMLNRERKASIDTALNIRKLILARADKRELLQKQITSYTPNNKFAPSDTFPDAAFFRKLFWFVELAVFTGRYKL